MIYLLKDKKSWFKCKNSRGFSNDSSTTLPSTGAMVQSIHPSRRHNLDPRIGIMMLPAEMCKNN